jgi:hypothetical protein
MKMKNENLYLKFVSKYSDDELLKGIENPSDFEKDVFYAILMESLKRELITKRQSDELMEAKINRINENVEDKEDGEPLNTEGYWKCPQCGQTVAMNFEACWNCQNYKPENIEHPTLTKIIEYQTYKKPFNIFKTGFSLIGLGILVLILSYLMTIPDFFGFHFLPLGKFLAGIIFVIVGFLFVLFGLFIKKSTNIQCNEKTLS